MMTNTYLPHVGGVARSVESFSQALKDLGHQVLVVAPEFAEMVLDEEGVLRVPAIQNFNGSDFSVSLPLLGLLEEPLDQFHPEVIHAHHPFLLGDTALREASARGLPIVFTHHTLYEEYTHYLTSGLGQGKDSPALSRFVIDLSTGYANLCDHVIAPSQSIADLLVSRGVTKPITVIPTGVNLKAFEGRSGLRFRKAHGLPLDAFVVGHLGRLAPEKNLMFLTRSVAEFLKAKPKAWFLVIGMGPLEVEMQAYLSEQGVAERVCFAGLLKGRKLVDGYAAMDVFAFASQSETQGMVLAEAMAAGIPVVAVDANGVREVVETGVNGLMLPTENEKDFVTALVSFSELSLEARKAFSRKARKTAQQLSMPVSVKKLDQVYRNLVKAKIAWTIPEQNLWDSAIRRIQTEWKIIGSMAHAAGTALAEPEKLESEPA